MSFVAIPDSIREDRRLFQLSERALAFFQLLLPQVDAWGRIAGDPDLLRSYVWPLSKRTAAETEKSLQECQAQGLVRVYEAGGIRVVQVTGWDETYRPVGAAPSRRPKSRYQECGPDTPTKTCTQPALVYEELPTCRQLSGTVSVSEERESAEREGRKPSAKDLAKAAWDEAWLKVRASPFGWNKKDEQAVGRCLAMAGDAGPLEITRRALKLLREDDAWLRKRQHPRGLEDEWNRWPAAPPPKAPEPPPIPANLSFADDLFLDKSCPTTALPS